MHKRKVLLVDDERDLVELLTVRLESSGYEVISADNGADGFKKAKTEKPDLIILDLMLPKMDGYKVCGLLKADSRYSKIPIIMFTARAQESDKDMGREVGAQAYITKPFEPKALLDKISSLLGEGD